VGLDVLDVGCNTGYGTVHLLPAARRVVGVDVSPRAIELAQQRAPGGSPEFLVTSGGALPFPDASFDLVTSFQVLEHVPDPSPYLGEIRRVLRPGGTLILTTPNAAVRLFPGMRPWNRFHVREYLPAELRELLEGELSDVRVRGLFATPTLYELQVGRFDAARRSVARREAKERAAAAKATAPARRRPWHRRLAHAAVPGFARKWLRSTFLRPATRPAAAASPPAAAVAEVDLETFLRFSLADLFYADNDLDRAMDLMAICRPDGTSAVERRPD
jgi:SAM-dependent methyltransferase